MINRYPLSGQTKYRKTLVASNVAGTGTSTTQQWVTNISGEPGALVTFKVTAYSHSAGGANYTVDGTAHVLNDTFTRTLDSSGNVSFVQLVDVGTTAAGNGIAVTLTIESTTIGTTGIPNSTSISKTI